MTILLTASLINTVYTQNNISIHMDSAVHMKSQNDLAKSEQNSLQVKKYLV